MVLWQKPLTIPLWSKFYHRSGLPCPVKVYFHLWPKRTRGQHISSKKKKKSIQRVLLNSFSFLGLHPIVILTKVDLLCKLTELDTELVFHSNEVLQKASFWKISRSLMETVWNQVMELSKKFGTPPNLIFPVRNYNMETECNMSIDILNLRAQRQILRNSVEYLEDALDLLAAERKQDKRREDERKQEKREKTQRCKS